MIDAIRILKKIMSEIMLDVKPRMREDIPAEKKLIIIRVLWPNLSVSNPLGI